MSNLRSTPRCSSLSGLENEVKGHNNNLDLIKNYRKIDENWLIFASSLENFWCIYFPCFDFRIIARLPNDFIFVLTVMKSRFILQASFSDHILKDLMIKSKLVIATTWIKWSKNERSQSDPWHSVTHLFIKIHNKNFLCKFISFAI